jgi:flagellar biosynthesis GTPase FlhF
MTRRVRYIPDWLSLAESRDLLVAEGQRSRSEVEADITLALRDRKIPWRSADKIVITTFDGRIIHPQSPAILNLKRQAQWRVSPPRDLAPGDLDFETSAPRKPWIAPGFYAHIGRLELSSRFLLRVLSLVAAKTSSKAHEAAAQADAERKLAEAKRKRKLAEAKRKRKRVEERAAHEAREAAAQAEAERERAEAKKKRKLAEAKRKRKHAEDRAAREKASHANETGRVQPRRYWARKAIEGAYPNGPPSKDDVLNRVFVGEVMGFAKTKGWNVGGYDTVLREAGRRK